MDSLPRRVAWHHHTGPATQPLLSREWLVTHGLSGYASGALVNFCETIVMKLSTCLGGPIVGGYCGGGPAHLS